MIEEIGSEISKEELWKRYKMFCDEIEKPVETKWNLTKKIKESFTYVEEYRKHGGERWWKNINISIPPPPR